MIRQMKASPALLLSLLVVLLTVAGIWLPEVRHNWVATPHYSDAVMQSARSTPDDAQLLEWSRIEFDFPTTSSDKKVILQDAEMILRGQWNNRPFGVKNFQFPFAARDLATSWPTQQLHYASMDHVDVLLAAYVFSNDNRYLAAARDVINGWAAYERGTIFGSGYLWNDHAVAQRTLVLTKYWQLIRHSPLLDAKSLELLTGFVGRTGRLLAKPDQYTARTNHGIMENLALLHIAASFPALPDSVEFRRVALERLRAQLAYYQSDEGVILEHSMSYHGLGTRLLATLQKYGGEFDADFTRDLDNRVKKACDFALDMLRPDSGMPMIGNTGAMPEALPCFAPVATPDKSRQNQPTQKLYPVSGFASVWYNHGVAADPSRPASQTVITWSNFASQAHKHDDELSLVTWYQGLPLLTGAGYWPYGEDRIKVANGWRGSNAPYLDDDALATGRSSELLANAAGNDVTFVDLVRTNAGSPVRIERQILTLGPGKWLTVDFIEGAAGRSQNAVWTLYPGWKVEQQTGTDAFTARYGDSGPQLQASFASSAPLKLATLNGSDSPFGGWVALDSAPSAITRATSLQSTASTGSPLATFWSVDSDLPQSQVAISSWSSTSHWSICLDGVRCEWRVARDGMQLTTQLDRASAVLQLQEVAAQAPAQQVINGLYRAAVTRFPYWRDLYQWRTQAMWLVIELFLASELLFWLLARKWPAGPTIAGSRLGLLHSAMPVFWIVIGSAIVFWYFGF
jgi:hypothetical protein